MEEKILVRKYNPEDIDSMAAIWNEAAEESAAFPPEGSKR